MKEKLIMSENACHTLVRVSQRQDLIKLLQESGDVILLDRKLLSEIVEFVESVEIAPPQTRERGSVREAT